MKKIISRLMLLFAVVYSIPISAHAVDMLIPIGRVVGLELHNNTVTVAAVEENSAANTAGVQAGDLLISIDNRVIQTAEDVRTALDQSQGSIHLTVQRCGELKKFRIHK